MGFKIAHNFVSALAVKKGINNFPGIDKNYDPCLTTSKIIENLHKLYYFCINPLIEVFGENDIGITSSYRCIALQEALGGNIQSPHCSGQAIDVVSFSRSSSIVWNWCYQNLPEWHQLICEYPERGDRGSSVHVVNQPNNFSWVHISFVDGNNPKTASLSTKKESLHTTYRTDRTTRRGDYTHNITLADDNLL